MTRRLEPEEIPADRVRRWDAYRDTLDDQGQKDLDGLLLALCDAIRARGKGFGRECGKELLMALLEMPKPGRDHGHHG